MKDISLNFGAIRDSVYNFSSKQLFKQENGENKTAKSFIKEMKESHILKLQYLIYRNLETANFKKERLAERYINQNIKLLEGVSWRDLLKENQKVRQTLLEGYHVEGKDELKGELYENIHTLIESATRKGFNDINSSEEAFENILTYLMREVEEKPTEKETETDDMPKFFSKSYITERAVSNFNKRYSHLNEVEQNLLKILLSTHEDKINHYEHLKNENIEIIKNLYEENLDKKTKKTLEGFEKRMNENTNIDSENVNEIIINYAELNETLKTF